MLYEWKHIIISHKHLLADSPGVPRQWWFGGGTDFTPAYIIEEDVKHFHTVSLNTLSFLSFWIIWLSSEERFTALYKKDVNLATKETNNQILFH